jgi:hypothetical protein
MVRLIVRSLAVCLLVLFPTQVRTQASEAAAGVGTGTRIGNIISTAIDTALPVIGRIMDIFRPNSKADDTVKKRDVEAAVLKAQAAVQSKAREQLQALGAVATELAVVQAFATAGAAARINMVNITHYLAQTPRDFGRIQTEWKVAKAQLRDVEALRNDDLKAVRDPVVRVQCESVRNLNRDLTIRIDDAISRGLRGGAEADSAAQELADPVARVTVLLGGFDALAAIELENLQGDIASLATWASAPAGGRNLQVTPAPPNALLMDILTKATASPR